MFAYFLLIVTYVLHSADVLIMNFIAEAPEFECRLKETEKVLVRCLCVNNEYAIKMLATKPKPNC